MLQRDVKLCFAFRAVVHVLVWPFMDKGIFNVKLLPTLEQKMTQDSDEDCKYFAQQAIEAFTS